MNVRQLNLAGLRVIGASSLAIALLVACAQAPVAQSTSPANGQNRLTVQSASGLRLMVAVEDDDPALRVALPNGAAADRPIYILFPEHVTALRRGRTIAEQIHLFRPGRRGQPQRWRVQGHALEYDRDLGGGVHLLARATLEDDGVRFRYEFTNSSRDSFAMLTAVTDPRLTSIFHDPRLERTFVHHADGFDLLASETPSRLTLPLNQWLPARYLASFRWPVPALLVERREAGITHYNKSRAVDEPFIATRSSDDRWVVASFTSETGNVWSNPALTCQHVDPQTSLGPGERATLEVKMLILRGSLNDALLRARQQRPLMK